MPVSSKLLAGLGIAVRNRLATRATRFRLAVTAGFLVSAVGFTTIVVNDQDSIADTAWGLGSLFGLQPPAEPAAPQAAEAAPSRGWGWLAPRRHAHREAHRRVAKLDAVRFIRSAEHAHASEGPVELGRRSMCVRLCDGFTFPVGAYHGEEDRASHEATCRSECPGATTALYIVPSGADSMDDAVRVGTDKTYSELPYAFHYTTVLSSACSCHPPEGSRIKSLLRDFTLRRGDAVMTAAGFKVFHGAARFPYRRSDFVRLDQSRDVRKGDRATFREIERASVISVPSVVAGVRLAKPTAPVQATATKGLEHQASLTPAGPTPPSP